MEQTLQQSTNKFFIMPLRFIPHALALFRDGGAWITTILAAPFIANVLNSPSFWGAVVSGVLIFLARMVEIRAKVTYWKWRAEEAERRLAAPCSNCDEIDPRYPVPLDAPIKPRKLLKRR